jgi:hypothetical protein
MGLADALGVDLGVEMVEHAPEGRFIPITLVRDQAGLNDFIVQMVPLLHAAPEAARPIKYVVTELVRNVLEHAASSVGALVCAQHYAETNRLSLGVADLGIGIRASITRFHHRAERPRSHPPRTASQSHGVDSHGRGQRAERRRPGCSSRSRSLTCLVTSSWCTAGSSMFKLLKGSREGELELFSDPSADRATREVDLPAWPGTAVGIDINVGAHDEFSQLLRDIRRAYSLDVRDQNKAKYRQPRFA